MSKIKLNKLSPAPWEWDETATTVRITASNAGSSGCCKTVCNQTVNDKTGPAYPIALADLSFIVLARNAFDGDPEALAWWEANRRRRQKVHSPKMKKS